MKYSQIIEECKDIYTELSFTSRWLRIEAFHRVGLLLLENEFPPDKIPSLAYSLQVKPSDIAKGILLAERYPDLNDLPADKTISWSQIEKYL